MKTRVYRLIVEIGRWSNVDVFTIAIFLPLMQFGSLLSVHAGTGAPAFLAVIVLTMFAVRFFDPRLMWDNARGPARAMSESGIAAGGRASAGGPAGSGPCRSRRCASSDISPSRSSRPRPIGDGDISQRRGREAGDTKVQYQGLQVGRSNP